MNVPVTYPPARINGFMISGLLSPNVDQASEPVDLLNRYERDCGPYRIAPNIQYKEGNESAFIEDLYDLIRTRGEWALKLLENENTDVLMVHFIAMDLMAMWPSSEINQRLIGI